MGSGFSGLMGGGRDGGAGSGGGGGGGGGYAGVGLEVNQTVPYQFGEPSIPSFGTGSGLMEYSGADLVGDTLFPPATHYAGQPSLPPFRCEGVRVCVSTCIKQHNITHTLFLLTITITSL